MEFERLWRVLLVEDDEEDYLLTSTMLKEARSGLIELDWLTNPQDALRAVGQSHYDAVLVDYHLGAESGLDLVREAVGGGFKVPFILLTGRGSYEVDVEAMQAGVMDYLPKGEVSPALLERTIRYAIERQRLQEVILQAAVEATKRAEELNAVLQQLENEQSKLNALINNAPSAIVLTDPQARIILANPIANQLYAWPVPLNQPYESHVQLHICHPNGAPYDPKDLPLTRSALHGETFNNAELMIVWPDGQRRSILVNSAPTRDHSGQITGAVAVFSDITEHKKSEQEVRRSLTQIEVQRRLMQSREKERLRIAQDLHDGPLQGLIGLTFEIKEILGDVEQSPLKDRLNHLEETLQAQIREIRSFSQQLRPPALTPFGLEKAIRSHMNEFSASHKEMQFYLELDQDGRKLPEEVRLVLFRIYQELLNNIIRHAEATEVWVRLGIHPKEVKLEVQDNGCGFEVPTSWIEIARQGHLGLVGVQERADSVDGFVDILSSTGKGTTIRVTIPLA